MASTPSCRDDALTAVVALGIGTAVGLSVLVPSASITYLLAETQCSSEYMCGLGAAVTAMLIGGALGLVGFLGASLRYLCGQRPAGERWRAGVLAFVGLPGSLAMLFAMTAVT